MEDFIFSKELNISQHFDLPFPVKRNSGIENAGTNVVICSGIFSMPEIEESDVKQLEVKGEVHIALLVCLRPQNGLYRKFKFATPFSTSIDVPRMADEEAPIRVEANVLDVTTIVLMPGRIYTSVTMTIGYLAQ